MTPAVRQALEDAGERAEDLHVLWQWQRSLSYRIRLARLKFEYIGLDADEQNELAAEVAQFTALVMALSEARAAA